jgi:hypothetical protein
MSSMGLIISQLNDAPAFVQREIDTWTRVIKAAGIKGQ